MMRVSEVHNILAQCRYPGYTFAVHGTFAQDEGATYLQATFDAPCTTAGDVQPQKTRKWMLSPHMTRSEIVQTTFKCVLTAVEHEARENFRYRGQTIYGPHFDVEALVAHRKADLDHAAVRTAAPQLGEQA